MFLERSDCGELENVLATIDLPPGWGLFVMVAAGGQPDLAEIVRVLQRRGGRFFGALFPALICEQGVREEGIHLLPLPMAEDPLVIRDLASAELPPTWEDRLVNIPPGSTVIALSDGMTPGGEAIMSRIYYTLGDSVRYLGGGAGGHQMRPVPCLLTADGVIQGGAVFGFCNWKCSMGVRHGWKPWRGPYVVSRAAGIEVQELNGRDAFAVYRDVMQAAGIAVGEQDFYTIAREYPLGMMRERAESVVRAPVAVRNDRYIVCVGDVPENSMVEILHGTMEDVLAAAEQAAMACSAALDGVPQGILLLDCVSRFRLLGERFDEEIGRVRRGLGQFAGAEVSFQGALTWGELAAFGDGMLELYNQTVVVAAFQERR